MLKAYKVNRLIDAAGWFDRADQGQYDKLYDMIRDGLPVHDIAVAIYICTEDESLERIEEELEAL